MISGIVTLIFGIVLIGTGSVSGSLEGVQSLLGVSGSPEGVQSLLGNTRYY